MTVAIDSQTLTIALAVISLISVMFNVYNYFKNPQIQIEKDSLVTKAELSGLLTKFNEFSAAFQAHLAADVASFSMLNQHVVEVDKSVVKLTTIIDERIPKKE